VALPLAGCRLVRPLGIIQRRQRKLSTAAARFLELLRSAGTGPGEGAAAGRLAGGTATQPRANGRHRDRNGASRAPKKTTPPRD
jgi:hypothetical protein